MLSKLRLKFTLLFSTMASILLFIVLICAFFFAKKQLYTRSKLNIASELSSLKNYILTNNSINQNWLFQLEANNTQIIHIEENGIPLLFQGSYHPKTDKEMLIEEAKKLCDKKKINSPSNNDTTFFSKSAQSFDLKTKDNEHFLITSTRFTFHNAPYTILLIDNMYEEDRQAYFLIFPFAGLALLCLISLTIISYWFAGKAIAPIAKSNQQQKHFIAAVSHELRSPLAVLQTNADALLQKVPAEDAHFLSAISNESQRMSKLVGDLLLLTNADANHNWQLDLSQAEADTLLLEIYDLAYIEGNKCHHPLHLTLPETPVPPCLLDTARVKQILMILIDNAFSHTPDNCDITLLLTVMQHQLCFKVIDNGPGIPDEEKPLIYDRFYQSDKSRHNKAHYGLGLSIAQELTQLHHGTLTTQDTPGGGCTFILTLPLTLSKSMTKKDAYHN